MPKTPKPTLSQVAPLNVATYRTDIVSGLRAIADGIESGEFEPVNMLVVHDDLKAEDTAAIQVYTLGRDADSLCHNLGLLELGKDTLLFS